MTAPLLLPLLLPMAANLQPPSEPRRCPDPQPPGASEFRTGDLVFVRPHLDARHSSLDAGILATGAATIAWLRAQGVAVPGNETVTHVAMARVNASTGCLSFVQAVPPVVTETSALDFWHSSLPTTTFYRAWFRDGALQSQLAEAALTEARAQLGKPYANDFEPPPSKFYCSSLVEWSFSMAASGRRVFLPPPVPTFTLIFEPRDFWKQYYKTLGLKLPVNVTGSNPTLLLHSPAMSFNEVGHTAIVREPGIDTNGNSDSTETKNSAKQVSWSGHNWLVKDSQGSKAGPGPNVFSQRNVAVDPTTGKLHLSITPIHRSTEPGWSCAEIFLPANSAMGYGEYRWIVETPLSALGGDNQFAKRPVLGMFLYKDDSHEIDIEMSRWNNGYGMNKTADYAVQPFSPHVETALHWTEPIHAAPTYHQFTWTPKMVAFESGLVGQQGGDETVIQRWNFTNSTRIPSADGMLVHVNWWLFQGKSDLPSGESLEVVLKTFRFRHLDAQTL